MRTRRDGMAGARRSDGGMRGGMRGGGGRRGGGARRGKEERIGREERVLLEQVNKQAQEGFKSPFADFFKSQGDLKPKEDSKD